MTVEDPIEYELDGIGQTQVNTKIELTFARGLRAILRQDPDVIMVGEIRDLETAQIAVQASLPATSCCRRCTPTTRRRRGHAPARHGRRAVPAVVEPDRRARAAAGARARPRHCACRTPPSEYERRLLNVDPANLADALSFAGRDDRRLSRAAPASTSSSMVDDTMRTMIHDGAGEHELERYARTLTPSIRDDGMQKVLARRRRRSRRSVRVTREPTDGRVRIRRASIRAAKSTRRARRRHAAARPAAAAREAALPRRGRRSRAARAQSPGASSACGAASRASTSRSSPASSRRWCAPACRSRKRCSRSAADREAPRSRASSSACAPR